MSALDWQVCLLAAGAKGVRHGGPESGNDAQTFTFDPGRPRGSANGLSDPIAPQTAAKKQLRSYRKEVSSWGGKIARRYVVGLAILIGGGLFVLVAAGFGVAAVFHFLALHYGVKIAFLVLEGVF